MIEDFINKHRPLVITLFILVVVGIVAGIIIKSVHDNTSSNTTVVGVDGSEGDGFHGYSNYLYTISAPVHNVIQIDSYNGYRNAAVKQIYNAGFNPTNYKIIFNYESPFKPYE